MQIDINTILQIITTVGFGAFSWMFKNIYGDFKLATEKLSKHSVRLALLEEKVARLEHVPPVDLSERLE